MTDSVLYAFEPFSTLAGVLRGEPIKIMPVGTFYRDNRKLVITPERLQGFATNLKAGLPRFKVPINENHAGVGKVGTVSDVAYLEAGPDGAGLYATGYELTEQGKQLITDKRFDAVSPETVWTLNDGATYMDPTTGKKHDNVLVGLALTDRPFFGHDNVALFSDSPKRHNGYTKLKEKMKAQFAEWLAGMSDDEEAPMPTDKPAVEAAHVIGAKMTDKPAPTPEQFVVKQEEFEALQAKAAKAEALEAQVEQFAAQLKASNKARRLEQLTARAERFMAVPVPAAELAEKFQAIEEASPELAQYFDGLLETMDKQVATGALFTQTGTARKVDTPETLDEVAQTIIKEKFGGDKGKYSEAFIEAGKRRPDLATAFVTGR